MIPCDTKNIKDEFNILMNELRQYNPELLDKSRVLAITKCDMLDKGMIAEMKRNCRKRLKQFLSRQLLQQVLKS